MFIFPNVHSLRDSGIAGIFPQLRPHAPAPCEDPRPAKPYEDGRSGYVDNNIRQKISVDN